MKKKNVFSAIAATAMAAAMCVAFVGCDKAASIKSDEVTEEEWVAAFADANFDNYKVIYKVTTEGKNSEGEKGGTTVEYELVEVGKLTSLTIKNTYSGAAVEKDSEGNEIKEVTQETFADRSGTIPAFYEKKDGAWKRNLLGGDYGTQMVIGTFLTVKNMYSLYEYSADDKGYVLKDESVNSALIGVVYKFKDGKLAAIYGEHEKNETKGVLSIVFTYGGQSLTVPTVAE